MYIYCTTTMLIVQSRLFRLLITYIENQLIITLQGYKEIQGVLSQYNRFIDSRSVRICAVYRIVASTSPSRFGAHAGLFRLLMKGIFYPYLL